MTKLIGTGNNQVSTNGMLGGMAFQSPEGVQVDKLQEQRYNVVTQQDIGTAPNQVPLNQNLGTMAYQDSEGIRVDKIVVDGPLYVNAQKLDVGSGGTGYLMGATPAYTEYQFSWSGQKSTTAVFTCGSYMHAEVIYVSHQTNAGSDIHRYIRGKWANNYTTHTWVAHEDVGNTWSVSLSITVSDNTAGGGTTQTGRLTIQETFNGSGSKSTSYVIIKVYYGSINYSIT